MELFSYTNPLIFSARGGGGGRNQSRLRLWDGVADRRGSATSLLGPPPIEDSGKWCAPRRPPSDGCVRSHCRLSDLSCVDIADSNRGLTESGSSER